VSLKAQGSAQGSIAAGSVADILKAVQTAESVDKEKQKLQAEADILDLQVKIKKIKKL
jgi:hypothetical protein